MTDSVCGVGDHFPLGRAFGSVEIMPESPSGSATRPFGLRYLEVPISEATVELDTSSLIYDSATQMAWARDGAVLVPMSKHKSRKTKTATQRDDKNAPDDDEDVGG